MAEMTNPSVNFSVEVAKRLPTAYYLHRRIRKFYTGTSDYKREHLDDVLRDLGEYLELLRWFRDNGMPLKLVCLLVDFLAKAEIELTLSVPDDWRPEEH